MRSKCNIEPLCKPLRANELLIMNEKWSPKEMTNIMDIDETCHLILCP